MKKSKYIIVVGGQSYFNPFYKLEIPEYKVKVRGTNYLRRPKDDILGVVFTGGEDVDPSLYNGKKHKLSMTSLKRDIYEKSIFQFCKDSNIKMMAICRGLQFLNVMAGGRMFQHVNGHAGTNHLIFYPALRKQFLVNSLHHQMVDLSADGIPIAWSDPNRVSMAIDYNGYMSGLPRREIEAAVFPKDNSFGVQFHPELMEGDPRRLDRYSADANKQFNYESGRSLYISMVEDFLTTRIERFTEKYGCAGG